MGAKTKEVGGGSATGVANNFSNFLNSQLMGTPQRQAGSGTALQQPMGIPGMTPEIWGKLTQGMSNAQQPQQQTSAFQNAFGGALSGQVNDISGAGGAIQNYFKNMGGGAPAMPSWVDSRAAAADPQGFAQWQQSMANQGQGQQVNMNPMGTALNSSQMGPFTNQYTPQTFVGANLNNLPTNFGAGQTGMADLSGFGNAAQSGFNTQAPLRNAGNSAFDSMLMNMIGSGGNIQGISGQSGFNRAQLGAAPQLAGGMDYRAAYDTLGQDPLMERNRMKAVADMRARFGAEGAGSLGTGAQFAEGNLNAELAAQDASNRRNQAMQLMGQDLAERSTGANVALQGRGQDLQLGLGNMQGGLQGAQNVNQVSIANQGNQVSNMGNMLSAMTQGRGQDFSTQLGMRGQDLSQLGLGAEQSMFNAGQQNGMQGNMLQAILQNQGMGNNFGLGAAGLNNAAMQTNNANAMGMAGMQNNFNLANAGNTAQFGNAAQQGNANFFQNMVNQGMGMNQLGNQNTMGMLAQLFGGFGQAQGLGTAQRQLIQQPSAFGQAMNGLMGLGGAWLRGGGGNPFGGGGGGAPVMPTSMPQNVPMPMPGNLFGGANFGVGNPGGWSPTTPMWANAFGPMGSNGWYE